MSIAVDLRRVPDRLQMNRQRAPRQMWNNVERPLHVLANLVIAVGLIQGSLDREGSGAPALVRHDRVRAHERAARGRVDGVSLGHAQGKQKRAGCGEPQRRGESSGSIGFGHRNMLLTGSMHAIKRSTRHWTLRCLLLFRVSTAERDDSRCQTIANTRVSVSRRKTL